MLSQKKSVFFFSFLLLCALGVNAQTSVKQVTDAPKPRTTEVRENVWQVEREAVSPVGKEAAQQTLQEQPMRQKMANPITNEARQMLEQNAITDAENAVKAKKEAETVETEKARLAEVDKPSNDEWRTRIEMENAKYQSIAIPEEGSRTTIEANWEMLIQQTENELTQTNDPAIRQKIQNKLTGLRKKEQEAQQSDIK